MKRFGYMLLCVLPLALLCTLCGCSSLSLGERAIVKAIYLDGTPGSYTASLVVFTCEPTTDTASAKGEAKIYSATEEDIGEALEAAEKEQAKVPFYAQNELLFLGPQITQTGIGKHLPILPVNRQPGPIFLYLLCRWTHRRSKSWKRRLLRPFRRQSVWRTTHRWEWAAR